MGRRRIAMAFAGAVVLALSACGGGSTGSVDPTPRSDLPLVDEMGPAVEALELELGGAQEYFEINADIRLVNLFVATDGGESATPYVYLDGELGPPGPPLEVSTGRTFTADDLVFDPDRVLERVTAELEQSTIAGFVVLVGPDGVVRHEVLVQSRQGGTLAVAVGPDGDVLEVVPLR